MKNLLLGSLVALTMVACSSGGNGGGAPGYTHNELAQKFVQELNLDADFNVSLIKKSTDQRDFIVIYDPLTDSYDAIDIENYDPALDNAADYYTTNSALYYYDLDEIPGHYEARTVSGWVDYEYWDDDLEMYVTDSYYDTWVEDVWVPTKYRDRYTNLYFEKTQASPKDLAKVAALKEAATISKSAEFLSTNYGLSLNRAKEVARLTTHWKKASKKGMTDAELDSFSTELLGFSITAGKDAATDAIQGNTQALDVLIGKAAVANSISPEHVKKLMSQVFGL